MTWYNVGSPKSGNPIINDLRHSICMYTQYTFEFVLVGEVNNES